MADVSDSPSFYPFSSSLPTCMSWMSQRVVHCSLARLMLHVHSATMPHIASGGEGPVTGIALSSASCHLSLSNSLGTFFPLVCPSWFKHPLWVWETKLHYVKMVRDFILKVKGLDTKSWLLSNHSASNMYKISLETVYSSCYFTVWASKWSAVTLFQKRKGKVSLKWLIHQTTFLQSSASRRSCLWACSPVIT